MLLICMSFFSYTFTPFLCSAFLSWMLYKISVLTSWLYGALTCMMESCIHVMMNSPFPTEIVKCFTLRRNPGECSPSKGIAFRPAILAHHWADDILVGWEFGAELRSIFVVVSASAIRMKVDRQPTKLGCAQMSISKFGDTGLSSEELLPFIFKKKHFYSL